VTAHVHTWAPIPLLFARYECSCGATGYRGRSGCIVEHKAKLGRIADVTVKGRTTGDGGAVPAYHYKDTGARNK
jgi:hypothetical protein